MKKFIICSLFFLKIWADDRIVAFVEDEVITQKELDYALEEGMDIEEMINSILFQKKARELGVVVPETMVIERIGEIRGRFTSNHLFKAALEKAGMDESLFKKRISQELTKARLINFLKGRIKIKEEELISNFNNWQEEVNVYFLKAEDKEDAERVFIELTRNGTTTAKIEISGFFCFPEMQEEFSREAYKLDEGKISHPFKIKDKFYIIKMIERRETEDSHLAKIRDELFMDQMGMIRKKTPNEKRDDILSEILSLTEEHLKNKRFEEYLKEFLAKLKNAAYLKING